MLIDARTIPKNTTVPADVCIVGGGAAGITLARELIGQSFDVCLLESGGLQFDIATQALYQGRSVGFPYLPLEATRLRFFGGTTNHWGGASRPLDEQDFARREWVPYSGWPFDRAHLVPYYERAHAVLQLGPFVYSGTDWESATVTRAAFAGRTLNSAVFQQSPPTRFGQVYREELARARNVRTYLNANALEIETNATAHTVARLRVSSLARNDFFIAARVYILAAGGIETARLLLLSDKVNPSGVGNANGLVGRFFMEHPIAGWATPGIIAPLKFPLRFYEDRVPGTLVRDGIASNATLWGFIAPTQETLRRQRLLNFGIAVRRTPEPDPDAVESARRFKHSLATGEWPEDIWKHVGNVIADLDDVAAHGWRKLIGRERPAEKIEVMYWSEPQPNPDSRIYLSDELDALGQRRVVLDWRLTEHDKRNMQAALQLLATELGKAGLGRLRIDPRVSNGEWERVFLPSFHHMGTTRMSTDPALGVVDPNCRLHDVSNLYVASSSVFPAAGHANPTLTIVALALRLADHIKEQMKNRQEVV